MLPLKTQKRKQLGQAACQAYREFLMERRFACPTNWWASCLSILKYLHHLIVQDLDSAYSITTEMLSLIEGLLEKEVRSRLGCGGAG